MDPGYKLLQHIKTFPNLINEDPSVVTPKNTSFLDLPWENLSTLLASKQQQIAATTTTTAAAMGRRDSSTSVDSCSSSDKELGNWDSMTGFQDAEHTRQ
ncbi:hypothetical protein BX666DRAFT_1936010 [Dichotomocladium elegans]|nr:hypothetical protein BX666DRAFT_1936010 [Dichotomocladium elegans]